MPSQRDYIYNLCLVHPPAEEVHQAITDITTRLRWIHPLTYRADLPGGWSSHPAAYPSPSQTRQGYYPVDFLRPSTLRISIVWGTTTDGIRLVRISGCAFRKRPLIAKPHHFPWVIVTYKEFRKHGWHRNPSDTNPAINNTGWTLATLCQASQDWCAAILQSDRIAIQDKTILALTFHQ